VTRLALAGLLILILAGCGTDATAGGQEDPRTQLGTISRTPNQDPPSHVWHGTIDGRECIVVDDHAKTSLTCNWGAK